MKFFSSFLVEQPVDLYHSEQIRRSIEDEFAGQARKSGHIRLEKDSHTTETKHSPAMKRDLVLHTAASGVNSDLHDLIKHHAGGDEAERWQHTGQALIKAHDGSVHHLSAKHGTHHSEYSYIATKGA